MKRMFLGIISILLLIGSNSAILYSNEQYITDFAQIDKGHVRTIIKPTTIDELRHIVIENKDPISIAGGRFSHGGHIWYPQGTVIDMTGLTDIIMLDAIQKTITVQAGARWRQIQEYIEPYGLAVIAMQSFNDFTVGGSLSVNAHGRDIVYGSIVETVLSIVVLCADGQLITASRTENYDLFRAAIGGYGACGIIVQATLQLTDNYPIKRSVKRMSLEEYEKYFMAHIHHNPTIVFHSAQLYEEKLGEILAVTWRRTNKPLTDATPIQRIKSSYLKEKLIHEALLISPFRKNLRWLLEEWLYKNGSIVMRNYEMSTPINVLDPLTKSAGTEILQEYFVPLNKLNPFIAILRDTIWYYNIKVLNISIRYVPQDSTTFLSYAQSEEMFAVVLFINIPGNDHESLKAAQTWTRKLIDATLLVGGSYYLPYVCFATQEQFEKAYPNHKAFKMIKRLYNPQNKFLNCFTAHYLA